MRRIAALLIAAVMIASLLSACGQQTEPAVKHQGADSVEKLINATLEYIRSDGDFSKIEGVVDPQGSIAYALIKCSHNDDSDMEAYDWDTALEKAELVMQGADELKTADPVLAEKILEWTHAVSEEEYNSRMNDYLISYFYQIKMSLSNGKIKSDDPDYEMYTAMLTDWDKGADYIMEHYPEVFENLKNSVVVGLDQAIEKLSQKFLDSPGSKFKELECVFSPENIDIREDGYNMYNMGEGNEPGCWLEMMYYVKNETYYLIGYSVVWGATGG